MAQGWSIIGKTPSTAQSASINSSTGVANFPANPSTTTDNVYTIQYDNGSGCTASTTYTVKGKKTHSVTVSISFDESSCEQCGSMFYPSAFTLTFSENITGTITMKASGGCDSTSAVEHATGSVTVNNCDYAYVSTTNFNFLAINKGIRKLTVDSVTLNDGCNVYNIVSNSWEGSCEAQCVCYASAGGNVQCEASTSLVTVGSYSDNGSCTGSWSAIFTSGEDFLYDFSFSNGNIKAKVRQGSTAGTQTGIYSIGRGTCNNSVTFTQEKCTSESSINIYTHGLTFEPDGSLIYLEVDVRVNKGSDGLIDKYSDEVAYAKIPNLGNCTMDVYGFASPGKETSTQLGCLNSTRASECDCQPTVDEEQDFKVCEEASNISFTFAPNFNPSQQCVQSQINDINADLDPSWYDCPTYEGNGTWKYSGDFYTLEYVYYYDEPPTDGIIDISHLPQELKNIITIN